MKIVNGCSVDSIRLANIDRWIASISEQMVSPSPRCPPWQTEKKRTEQPIDIINLHRSIEWFVILWNRSVRSMFRLKERGENERATHRISMNRSNEKEFKFKRQTHRQPNQKSEEERERKVATSPLIVRFYHTALHFLLFNIIHFLCCRFVVSMKKKRPLKIRIAFVITLRSSASIS